MTSINVTRRGGPYGELLDWKRRSERLVRLSDAPYTVVRPSWFSASAGNRLVTAVPDAAGALDGARDADNLPLDKEPELVREDAVRFRAG
jgi:uncharacterized protein YbjT (DUF2867 family)